MDGIAVVTGASRGIGEAVVHGFAEAGATVVVCARDQSDVEAVAADIRSEGNEARAIRADVRDEYDVERLMETASRTGPSGIDYVVANAGVYHGSPGETPIGEESYAAFDDHLRTNARGVFSSIREALPHLAPDARVLVPTGSVARDPTPGVGTYAVSKAGAEAVARQFAADVEQVVGCVDPGRVDTRLSGAGGREPGAVADLFVWAAMDADPDELDGGVLGLREWKMATR
jgi:NAD(P)-dependent dehydrogenase (short-subunit alcohol dehydrogenase family)